MIDHLNGYNDEWDNEEIRFDKSIETPCDRPLTTREKLTLAKADLASAKSQEEAESAEWAIACFYSELLEERYHEEGF